MGGRARGLLLHESRSRVDRSNVRGCRDAGQGEEDGGADDDDDNDDDDDDEEDWREEERVGVGGLGVLGMGRRTTSCSATIELVPSVPSSGPSPNGCDDPTTLLS